MADAEQKTTPYDERFASMLSTLIGPSIVTSPCELHTVAVPLGFIQGVRNALMEFYTSRSDHTTSST